MKSYPFFICLVLLVASALAGNDCSTSNKLCQPEQIHLAFGEKINDITVTWATMLDTKESIVLFGEKKPDVKATGTSTLFIDDGEMKRKQWIHRVALKDLKHDTKYVYIAGSKYGMSKEFSFKAPPAGQDFVVNALFFGDMGVPDGEKHKTVEGLINELKGDHYHMAVHNGDLAYDLNSCNGMTGDAFLKMVEPVAANIPYMTTAGNHEIQYNYSNYKNRFTMPGNTENLYYSFNLGPVHFIAVNTDFYYSHGAATEITSEKEPLQAHFNWIVYDLKEANKKENREKQPWIIMYGHRPMYCTSSNAWDRCRDGNTDHDYPHRVGIPQYGGMAMEPLLKDYGVDIVIWAHEHYYERSWPVYNKTVYNGTHGAYINPGAPVHITTGAAGNHEVNDHFEKDPFAWSAFRSSDYGYGRLRIFNRTHLYWDEMSTDHVKTFRGGWEPTMIDSIWLIRDEHKPYDFK